MLNSSLYLFRAEIESETVSLRDINGEAQDINFILLPRIYKLTKSINLCTNHVVDTRSI